MTAAISDLASTLLRPQPIGIFAGIANALLLPTIDDPRQAEWHAELLRGNRELPLPAAWQFYEAALKGDRARALELLREYRLELSAKASSCARAANNLDVCDYNLFVLEPSASGYQLLQGRLSHPFRALLDIAAFSAGLEVELPVSWELDDEFLAWGLACWAALEIERENFLMARQKLATAREAASGVSPLLEAMLIAQSAQVAQSCLGLPAELVQDDFEAAIAIAEQHKLPGFVAELWTQLGMLLQESAGSDRNVWLSVIRAYQTALQTPVQAETHPRHYAELHNNLGLAYLAMPASGSSNQLRTGIAIQSFRTGLSALNPDTDGELWARIKMNLANALQYAPSSHPEGNLIQAVEIYEEVLTVRTKARDPVAYAIVLLNQANALAHLGIFKPSLEKAAEAYKLFQWYNQAEQATTARELVERVNDALSNHVPGSEPTVSPS